MSESLHDKAKRIARNAEMVLRGDIDDIDEATQKDLAEFVRDHLDGRSRVEIRLNDRVVVQGRRESDGTVIASLELDF